MRKLELSFFEGFCYGLAVMAVWIGGEHGLNFFLFNQWGPFNFQLCFRPMTLLILSVGAALLYRFTTRNSLQACLLTVLCFCYFDFLFLFTKSQTYEYSPYFYQRDFVMMMAASYCLLIMWTFKKRLNISKITPILLLVAVPVEYLLVKDFVAMTDPEWYLLQYMDLQYGLEDSLFKLVPFLCFILPSYWHKAKDGKKIYDKVE